MIFYLVMKQIIGNYHRQGTPESSDENHSQQRILFQKYYTLSRRLGHILSFYLPHLQNFIKISEEKKL
jgi:hypothetical protein